MTTNTEESNSSIAIGINLVNNPRDFIHDAILRSASGYDVTKSLIFSSVTRFIRKFDTLYSLFKNENQETENQFPYGMCNAYISDTFVDYALLEKDCIKFVKDQKTEVLHYLEELEVYLAKAVSERAGETPEIRNITKAALEAEIEVLQQKIITLQNKFPLEKLSSINEEKYTLKSIGLDYEKDLLKIKQKRLQFENQLKDLQKEIADLNKKIKIIHASNIAVTAIQDEYGEGLLKDTREAIDKQKVFLTDPFLEISLVYYALPLGILDHNYKLRKYGNSLFWATTMPKPFLDRDCTIAGQSRNKKNISTYKLFFAKRTYENESNPEVFEEEVYLNNEYTYIALCHIKKNTIDPQYGIFYLTAEDSPYLTSLLANRETLLKNKELDKPIEFYPVIPIREQNKDLVKYEPKEVLSTLGLACEELLRNLYINIYGITKAINELANKSIKIDIVAKNIMLYVKNRYDFVTSANVRPSYIQNDSSSLLINYYESKVNKSTRSSSLNITLDKLIQDVYLALGISVDNFDSASAKYLYQLFSTLKTECKVTKEVFEAYQDHQVNNSYKYLDAYNLENRISIRNTHFETLLTFNYIEEETFQDTWEYKNPIYTSILLNYTEVNVKPLKQTKVFQGTYEVWDTPTLILHDNNSEILTFDSGVTYDNNVLEIYKQITKTSYKKISIHGLKVTYNRRINLLPEFKRYPERAVGYYNSDSIKRNYRLSTDSTTLSLHYLNFYTDSQVANVSKDSELVIPKNNMDMSNFIIPLWHHDITEPSYVEKGTQYTINDVNNTLQKSLNLLMFTALQENQSTIVPTRQDYFVPQEHSKKVMLSYMESFISKFNKFEMFIRYLANTPNTDDDKDKEDYTNLFYQIATNPNVTAYCNVPPTYDNPAYMIGQNRVSLALSSQLMNNTSSFYFETLSQDNKIFGDVQDNKFKFK